MSVLGHYRTHIRKGSIHSKASKQVVRSCISDRTLCYHFNRLTQLTICGLILPIAVLICSVCLLIGCDRPLILVFSAGKKAFCQLIRSICRLISVDRALNWVFSAGKKAFCQLIYSICPLISVDRALIFTIAAE